MTGEERVEAAGDAIAAIVTARILGDNDLAVRILGESDIDAVAATAIAYVMALGRAIAEELLDTPFEEWWRRWCQAHAARL